MMSTLPVAIQRSLVHTFELGVAVAWFLVGISWLTAAHYTALHSSVGRELGYWQWIWSGMYVVAGPMIVYGILRKSVPARVAGLLLLGNGLSIQFIAAITGHVDARTFTYAVYAGVCYLRLIALRGIFVKRLTYEL